MLVHHDIQGLSTLNILVAKPIIGRVFGDQA